MPTALMAGRTLNFDDLVLTIHTAALAEDGWTRILNDVSQALSAEGAVRNRRDFARLPFFHDFRKHLHIAAPDPFGTYGPVADLLSRLAPHLTVAARNYWAAQSLQLLTRAPSNALDAVAAAVFALNQSGQLMFANRLGEDMIRQSAWVQVLHERLVPIPTLHPFDRFAAALSRVSSGQGCDIFVTDLATGAEAQVSISPLPVANDFWFLPTTPYSLVWITPIALREDVGRDMARLFDLTPAEQRILEKLIAGDDLQAAAASLRISIHTARTQLKSMFRKTGRRSQGQLLMLAARMATLSSNRG